MRRGFLGGKSKSSPLRIIKLKMAAKSLPLITGKDNLLNVKLELVQRTISAFKSVLFFYVCLFVFTVT